MGDLCVPLSLYLYDECSVARIQTNDRLRLYPSDHNIAQLKNHITDDHLRFDNDERFTQILAITHSHRDGWYHPPANIGSAARALHTMGLDDLVVVNPRYRLMTAVMPMQQVQAYYWTKLASQKISNMPLVIVHSFCSQRPITPNA